MVMEPVWTPAYVGLGSNLDDPPAQLRRAVMALGRVAQTQLVAVSRFYRNPPLGTRAQPHYVNAAAALLTRLPERDLLVALKGIETSQGRVREPGDHWGPRVLDLDLLVHGSARRSEDGLTLPHPGIAERNFVLFPLLEIAPGLTIPGLGPVAMLAARLRRDGLDLVD
jgi:2-amino-4-hydroxy-6-hydroxymethyldihydropteridine diphosphokinase